MNKQDRLDAAMRNIENRLYNVHQPADYRELQEQRKQFEQGRLYVSRQYHNTDWARPDFNGANRTHDVSYYYERRH